MTKYNAKLARIKAKEQIAKLRLEGLSQQAIAERLGIGQASVSRCLAELTQEWQEQTAQDVAALKAQELLELDLVKSEAWGEWHTSKASEHGGNPAYLKVIISAMAEQSKIRGTYAPAKQAITDPTGEVERTHAVWIVPPEMPLEQWQQAAQSLVLKH